MKPDKFTVRPDHRIDLSDFDPDDKSGFKDEDDASDKLQADVQRLREEQQLLYANQTYALLIVLQGMDSAGKDSTIAHVMSGLNPQGVDVHSFKQPSEEELNHDFLWRCVRVLPERGRIGIFNRSYYEEVLVARVEPEVLKNERIPKKVIPKDIWRQRFREIRHFEQHLVHNGTLVLKFFLHLSRGEQRRRLLRRLQRPDKYWKFSLSDLNTRKHWKQYQKAYEEMLPATSTDEAPWFVVPANNKWAAHVVVADIIVRRLAALKLKYPEPNAKKERAREAALRDLKG